MKTKLIISILAFGLIAEGMAQRAAIELTFIAINNMSYIQLDSIKVMNRSQGGDTTLYWPDTVLLLDQQVAIPELTKNSEGFTVFPNYPNPVTDQTTIVMYIPDKDKVVITIADILGRQIIRKEKLLDRGNHSFNFTPGAEKIIFLNAYWRGNTASVKILNSSANTIRSASLNYLGSINKLQLKFESTFRGFTYSTGDELLYVCYWDTLQSGMLDTPEESDIYALQFAYNMPCLGDPTVNYGGQVYNTIQIFNQCWLKENLNIGSMIQGTQAMTDNEVIEKYCYFNDVAYCDQYGGLYQYDEMMQYSDTPGIQGICPPGWHIPTDEEIKVLEGAVDNLYGIGDTEWDGWDFRGTDVGYRLKSDNGWWYGGSGSDSHGFTKLPGGLRFTNGNFTHYKNHAYFWSSNKDTDSYSWGRLIYTFNEISRISLNKEYGFSVRCVRD